MKAAKDFYENLAEVVDIHGTDSDESIAIQRNDDGSVEVKVFLLQGGDAVGDPYYRRQFLPEETKEIRVYLNGGTDRVESTGRPDKRIKVRIISEEGHKSQ